MTVGEAEYVVANRHLYDDATFHLAIETLEHAGRWPR